MFTDYHTHTPLCLHAAGTPEEFVEQAVKLGLAEYGIADHAPMPNEPFDDWRMKWADLPQYEEWISRAQNAAQPHHLAIRTGLECDWIPGIEPWITHLKTIRPWDYLIGSLHYLDDLAEFDNPLKKDFWNHVDIHQAWKRYWEMYADMAKSALFQIMGHPDLIKKFKFYPKGDLRTYYEPAIEAIAKSGSAIEINTAGWFKECEEQYPALDFLIMANQAGIPLVINSDAHAPQELGRNFTEAKNLALQAGFTHLTRFCQYEQTRVALV